MYETLVQDQHDEQRTVAAAQRAQAEVAHRQAHERAVVNGQQQYERVVRAWRSTRPEYAALAHAVKTEQPDERLLELGAAAGFAGWEVGELRELRKRAVAVQATAKNLKEATVALARIERELLALQTRREKAPTVGESDEAEQQIYLLTRIDGPRHAAMTAKAAAESATATMAAARDAGVV